MKNSILSITAAVLLSLLAPGCTPPGAAQDGNGQDTIPVRGDWVRLAIPNEPDNLHPYVSVHAMATYIRDQTYQFLTDINPHTLELEPVLAEKLAVIGEDKKSYQYRIRDEATWDDGKPITGYDYLFSTKCVINPLCPALHMRGYYEFLEEVVVDPNDPKKFTVHTNSVFFLGESALGGFEVIPKHLYDPKGLLDDITIAQLQHDPEGNIKEHPGLVEFSTYFYSEPYYRDPTKMFGSGPYKLESWEPGERITLVRKENWWGDKCKDNVFSLLAYPDKLVFKAIKDRAACVQALAADEVDMAWDIVPNDFDRISSDTTDPVHKSCKLHTGDTYSMLYLGLNSRPPKNRKPLLVEQPVRRALAHLTDVDRIIKVVYNGYGKRIVGPISPYNKREYHTGLKLIEFSVEKAKAILDSAGWKDSNGNGIRDKVVNGRLTELDIEFLVSTSSKTAPEMGELFAEDAIKAGVKINVVKEDFKLIGARLGKHDFDMFGLGLNGSPIPADMMQVWHTESWTSGSSNYTGFGDSTTDKLITQIRETIDAEERRPLYFKIQEAIYDYQPAIFMMSPQERLIVNKRFENQFTTTVRPGFKIRALWVPKEKQKFGNAPAKP
jgi:peptide/nickel transport system substrate-binding protein